MNTRWTGEMKVQSGEFSVLMYLVWGVTEIECELRASARWKSSDCDEWALRSER